MESREEQEPFIRLFERVVGQFSSNIAVVFNDQRLTYKQLNEQANRLAHALRENSCLTSKKESIVAVRLAPSIEAIVAILAIMKAGMVYVPLAVDAGISKERLAQIVEEAKPVFTIDELNIQRLLTHSNKENPAVAVSPNDLAYIMYSSGSTGKPKGIEVEHKGLCAPMKSHHDLVGFTEKDCIAQFASLGFDASVLEMMVALGAGGKLCVVPMELRNKPHRLCTYYTDHKVTMAMFTPSMLHELSEHNFPRLKIIEGMGEALSGKLVEKFPSKTFVNGYGPTEVSIASSIGIVKRADDIHAGFPILGLTFYVLIDGKLAEEGDGELCIAGSGLARGYFNNEPRTKEKFTEISHADNHAIKIHVYKTGDHVELKKGHAEHLEGAELKIKGRIDRQVKIYGKLVQPEMIDEILEKNSGVLSAYTDINFNDYGHPEITAYLILSDGTNETDINFLNLYNSVKNGIGRVAAPTRFVFVDEIPKTSVGKLDKVKLKQEAVALHIHRIRAESSGKTTMDVDIEGKLSAIWKSVLGNIDDVVLCGQDDFFYLGGTSILMMALTREICAVFKKGISIDVLEKNPTFSSMVRKIGRIINKENLASPFVAISDRFSVQERIPDRKTPVFFVHTLMSDGVEDYKKFGRYWNDQKAIYGINPLGLNGIQYADDSIEEAAEHYVESLIKLQPKGPYLLAGWSLGGIIAYEMARQLRMKGQDVAVVLIDSQSSLFVQGMTNEGFVEYLRDLHNKLAQYFFIGINFDVNQFEGKQKAQQIDLMFESLLRGAEEKNNGEELYKRLWTIRNFLMAILSYETKPCDFDVRLIAANETVRDCGERLCWPQEIVFRETECIPGDHHSIFSDLSQCRKLTGIVERMTQYQEAKLKLAPLAKEIAEKYSQIEDDFSEEQKQCYERLKLLNANQKRKVSVMGDSRFCGKLVDKICFEWMYSAQPRSFDFVLVIDGKRLSAESYNENVRFENIVHDACFGRDSFGQQLSPTVISQCFGMLQRSSVLVLVEHFDGITSDACRNVILDVLNRDEVSVVFTATSICKEWEELKMEPVIKQENYVPKAPSANTTAAVMSTQGIFPAPVSTAKSSVVFVKDLTTNDDIIAENEKGGASVVNAKTTEGGVLVQANDGDARIEGATAVGLVLASSRSSNMTVQEKELVQKEFDRNRQFFRLGKK